MTARVTPYLTFGGNAREAMEFYQSVFGGTLDIATFADLHRAESAAQERLVAHSMLKGTAGVVLMGSDTPTPEEHRPGGSFSVALGGDEADLTDYWARLSEGGTVTVPFATSAWGSLHGQCVDTFGTAWLLNVTGKPAA
ncbi:VOC family protein [Streptomyces sp. NPDC088354]|uniref:VOC family protein n=1 Tax=unclassified Streptomyces TaxID=2593676 RepID=UPI0029B54227|nr:VOC family protein [Streptomyces sp. MI02-7b]MDX3071101.1 VOC family protein [Streptomyces sp. MI02-7b]